jgi:hypothetical protein
MQFSARYLEKYLSFIYFLYKEGRAMLQYIMLFFCSVLFTGCASFDVNYDYDQTVDFASIKKYDWMPVSMKSWGNELTVKHIKLAANKQLQAKGLSISSANPDILIALHGGKEKKVGVQEWGYAYRDNDVYHSGLYSPRPLYREPLGRDSVEYRKGTETYEYEVGTIILDFVDAHKKELVWRGIAPGVVNPHMTPEDINVIVAKILMNYPPPKK